VPGSAGERVLDNVVAAAKRARRRLAGFGSEAWGGTPTIHLVDPVPDPARPGGFQTSGTTVDPTRNDIWMIVTAEAPPEPLERPFALLFGAQFAAAGALADLIEGYGLWAARVPPVDERLRDIDLPPLIHATGDVRVAMGLSFVSYLIRKESEDVFRRLVGTAQLGRVDATAVDLYGATLARLETAWRQDLAAGGRVRPRQFLRLSLAYLRPHRRKQAEVFVLMLLGLSFTVYFPFASRTLFDQAIPSGRYTQVAAVLGSLGVALAVTAVANLRRTYLSAWVSSAVVRDLRERMFDRLQTLSAGWYHRHSQGDVLSRLFNDVGVVELGLSSTLRDGAFQALSLVVSLTVLFTLNVFLALLVLLGVPLVAVVFRRMSGGARKRSVAVQERSSVVLTVAAENHSAQPIVRAFGLGSRERQRFSQASRRLFDAERRLSLFGGLFELSVELIMTLLRLAALAIGTWMIFQGSFTVGGLVAFLGLMGEALGPVTGLSGLGQQVQAATGALERVNEILESSPDVVDTENAVAVGPLRSAIELRGVSFTYDGGHQVLENINLTIAAGSRVALVGPSGSGKSTVLGLLMRSYDPDDGQVLYDGVDLRKVSSDVLRARLGVVYQDTFLFDTTLRENIAFGSATASDEDVRRAAVDAEVDAFVDQLPRGYDSLVGEGGGMLSGGQRQRVAIARALVRSPDILLLDEATSSLDPGTERQIDATLRRVAGQRTVVAVTHRLTSVTDYDRIVVLDRGRIVAEGRHDELLVQGGLYARLWAEQSGGAASLDVVDALGRVPGLRGVPADVLRAVVGRLTTVALRPGESVPDGAGKLLLVTGGRGVVQVPGLAGRLDPVAELRAGDVFGLQALLGGAQGTTLRAAEPLTALVMPAEVVSSLTAARPASGSEAGGDLPEAEVPRGTRLARAGFGSGQTQTILVDEMRELRVAATPAHPPVDHGGPGRPR
jgi:ATP-binding cassette subfamily B protein